LAQTEQALQASWPEFAQIVNPHVEVLSADELGRRLPAGTGLLTWAQVDDDLLLFAVTGGPSGRLHVHRNRLDPDRLDFLLTSFARACRTGDPVGAAGDAIARLLLRPLAACVQHLHRLVGVPLGAGH